MKTALLLLLCFFLSGLSAQTGVLWYADPNKSVTDNFRRLDDDGNSSGTSCVDNANNPVFAESRIDATYGRYWRITKPVGRKRGEFARMGSASKPVVPREGQTIYLGWRYRVLSYPDLNQGVAVFQWKSAGSPNLQNYPLNFYYDGTTLSLNAYGPKQRDGGSIDQWRTRLWSRALSENQWITIVLGINVSKDPRQGYVELWVNGSKQTLSNSQVDQYRAAISGDGKRAYHRTFDGSEVYPKWGSYNSSACNFRILSDFQDLRAGTSYTAARPRPAGSSRSVATTQLDREPAAGAAIELFPNPVVDELHLRQLPAGLRQVTVTDLAGRQVFATTPAADASSVSLDTAPLPTGIYLVNIYYGSAAERRRFVKR